MIIPRDPTPDPFEQLTQNEKEALARQQFEAQVKSNQNLITWIFTNLNKSEVSYEITIKIKHGEKRGLSYG